MKWPQRLLKRFDPVSATLLVAGVAAIILYGAWVKVITQDPEPANFGYKQEAQRIKQASDYRIKQMEEIHKLIKESRNDRR